MNKYFRLLLTIMLVVMAFVSATGISYADDQGSKSKYDPATLKNIYEQILKSENPDKAFTELPPEAQKALMDAFANDIKYTTTVTRDIGRGTIDLTLTVVGTLFGQEVSWFHQRIKWDYDGTYITGIPIHQSWGEATWPCSYQGIISESESGGVGYTYFHRFSQGRFTINIAGWPVITATPWIDEQVYGTGDFDWTSGN